MPDRELILSLRKTIEDQGDEITALEDRIRELEKLSNMMTGMSLPFRWLLKIVGGMLGVGALRWLVEGIHWLNAWLNAPMKVPH